MTYDKEIQGVKFRRDIYWEQFAEPGDSPNRNFWVEVHGETIDEDSDPHALAKRLEKIAGRILKIASFLRRMKR